MLQPKHCQHQAAGRLVTPCRSSLPVSAASRRWPSHAASRSQIPQQTGTFTQSASNYVSRLRCAAHRNRPEPNEQQPAAPPASSSNSAKATPAHDAAGGEKKIRDLQAALLQELFTLTSSTVAGHQGIKSDLDSEAARLEQALAVVREVSTQRQALVQEALRRDVALWQALKQQLQHILSLGSELGPWLLNSSQRLERQEGRVRELEEQLADLRREQQRAVQQQAVAQQQEAVGSGATQTAAAVVPGEEQGARCRKKKESVKGRKAWVEEGKEAGGGSGASRAVDGVVRDAKMSDLENSLDFMEDIVEQAADAVDYNSPYLMADSIKEYADTTYGGNGSWQCVVYPRGQGAFVCTGRACPSVLDMGSWTILLWRNA